MPHNDDDDENDDEDGDDDYDEDDEDEDDDDETKSENSIHSSVVGPSSVLTWGILATAEKTIYDK